MMLILPCVGRSHQARTGQKDKLMLIGRCLSNGMKTGATHGQYDGSRGAKQQALSVTKISNIWPTF